MNTSNVVSTSTTETKIKDKYFEQDQLSKTFEFQDLPRDCEKKSLNVILRSADLNEEVAIIRKFDEGSKPLFERKDVLFNIIDEGSGSQDFSATGKGNPRAQRSHIPTLQKFIENFKSTGKYVEAPSSKCIKSFADANVEKDLKSRSNTTDKPREKKPYFSDPVRERDRLKRLYGTSSRRRSRSRSPAHTRRHSPVRTRRSDNSPRRRRSTSRDKHRRHSPYRSSGRDYRDKKYHRRSYSRSPNRDYPIHRSSTITNRKRERDSNEQRTRDRKEETTSVIAPGPYIPVPVPIPDYGYSYSPWPLAPPPMWGPHPPHRPPPSHYGHYPIVPMMPALRPPHPIGYGGLAPAMHMPYPIPVAAYRPRPAQRYPPPKQNANNFQHSYKKPSK